MTFDAKVPILLKGHQEWFASIITQPLDAEDQMELISPTGQPMEVEAAEYLDPSPTLKPHQRIQIYCQQYWWRLLNVMHDAFPLVTRLFGYQEFNAKIGFPYLVKYPSYHFSLDLLGDRLCQWIEEEYTEADKGLVHDAAAIDWAFNTIFTVKQFPALEMQDVGEELLEKTLYLQPYVQLFHLQSNLFQLRRDFIQKPVDYWVENDFPPLEKGRDFYFVVSRTRSNDVTWEEVCKEEYETLELFREGASLDHICEWLEGKEEVGENFQVWLQDWVVTKWLTLSKT